jgi:pimeloyl-ACP methyl ester carboxylesterase
LLKGKPRILLKLNQANFADPTNTEDFGDEALVIHKKSSGSYATDLAIFVHGLGGSSYGCESTWGDLPKLVFDNFQSFDVGMYSYRTLLRRLQFWKSVPLDQEAKVLGGLLKTLSEYEGIILLGHSMGGLLCKGAVGYLINANQGEVVSKINALIMMATPQLGSIKVPRFLAWFSRDFQALRPHSRYVSDVNELFTNQIQTEVECSPNGRIHLPCYALVAESDFWVDSLSAGINLTDAQKMTVRGTHTSIVKPKSLDADGFRFIAKCIEHALSEQQDTFQNYKCVRAQVEDFKTMHEIALSLFGPAISDIARMCDWRRKNRRIFSVVKRVSVAPRKRDESIVGYFCVMPLRADAIEKLRCEEITGAEIEPQFILPDNKEPDGLYIGGVAGVDKHSRGSVLHFLLEHLRAFKKGRPLRVLARPVTPSGLRIVEQYGMQPADGIGGLNHIYDADISALKK